MVGAPIFSTNMAWNDKRPMSPHLQIYKLPLTAYVSIGNRITGVINSVAMVLLVLVIAAAAGNAADSSFILAVLNSWFGKLVLFGFTLTLYYHMCNGIRHLFWDVGMGFELETANKTAKVSIGVAVALTIITWIIASAS